VRQLQLHVGKLAKVGSPISVLASYPVPAHILKDLMIHNFPNVRKEMSGRVEWARTKREE